MSNQQKDGAVCELVFVVEGGADGIVEEDQYKFMYTLGLDNKFNVHMYIINAYHAENIEATMQSMSNNLGFAFSVHRSSSKSVAGAYLEHVIARHTTWRSTLANAPCNDSGSIQCTVQVVFINREMPARCATLNAASPSLYTRMLIQDCSFNGSSKSFADDTSKINTTKYLDDKHFKDWYAEHVNLRIPSQLSGWHSGLCAIQIDTLTRRNKDSYEKIYQSIGNDDTDKISKWTLASWYHITDPSPVDISLIPLYTTGIPTDQLIREMEFSIHNACRMSRKRVMIGVCTSRDMDLVHNSFTKLNPFIVPFRTPDLPDPKSHGILFCSCIQQQAFADDDIIYYADGNAVLGGSDLESRIRNMMQEPYGTYLSPHRFQVRTADHKVEGRRIISLDNKEYVSSNSKLAILEGEPESPYYMASEVIESYGSCFIIPFNAFRAVLFTVHHNMPRESACFSPFYHYGFRCMKTGNIHGLYAITYKDRTDVHLPPFCRMIQ